MNKDLRDALAAAEELGKEREVLRAKVQQLELSKGAAMEMTDNEYNAKIEAEWQNGYDAAKKEAAEERSKLLLRLSEEQKTNTRLIDQVANLAARVAKSEESNRELEERIYKLGLLCDSVSRLQNGFCPDVGEPRDNVTRIGLALKHLKETDRLVDSLQNIIGIYHFAMIRGVLDYKQASEEWAVLVPEVKAEIIAAAIPSKTERPIGEVNTCCPTCTRGGNCRICECHIGKPECYCKGQHNEFCPLHPSRREKPSEKRVEGA